MGTKNISISDQAYFRLASRKKPNESFTDVINRLTGRRSILELRGLLSKREGKTMLSEIRRARERSRRRMEETSRRMREASRA